MVSLPVAGLDGDAQQALGRTSHEIQLAGTIVGEEALETLRSIQEKASAGGEVTFHADIVTALEVEHSVVVEAEFVETAGRPDHYDYFLHLRESPPLPEPVDVGPFGGLDGFGIDDLGFDGLPDVLDDISNLAEQAQGALDAVNDAINTLGALASLGDLAVDSPVGPLQQEGEKLSGLAEAASAVGSLGELLGGGG
jgi:hypothetical protein